MSKQEFEKLLFLSSVQLNQLNTQKIPTGFASGVLVKYHGKNLLLTVSHATGNCENWAIQIKYVIGKGTKNYQLGAMNFLTKISLPTLAIKDVDFSYVVVPKSIVGYRQEIENQNIIKSETPIKIHQTNLNDIPSLKGNYGFCGMVMPTHEKHFGQSYIGGELRVYSGLSYLRTEEDYHIFKLPFKHPGHEHFKGCSGAPILDESGKLFGLVCNGDHKTDEIYAISLKSYKIGVDILVGNIN